MISFKQFLLSENKKPKPFYIIKEDTAQDRLEGTCELVKKYINDTPYQKNPLNESKYYKQYFECPDEKTALQIKNDIIKHGGKCEVKNKNVYFYDKETFDYSVYHHKMKLGPAGKNMVKNLNEESPANNVGSGNIAGANNDPPVKINNKIIKRKKLNDQNI